MATYQQVPYINVNDQNNNNMCNGLAQTRRSASPI